MKEKFPALFAALQVEEMQMQEGGAFMNEELLATLNTAIEENQKAAADAKAQAEQLTTEKAELESQLAAKATEIETLNAEHATAIEEKDNAIAALEQEKAQLQGDMEGQKAQIEALNKEKEESAAQLSTLNSELSTLNGTIAERDQQISDLNAQIEELNKEPGEGAQAGSPANNGAGVEEAEVAISTQYAYDNSKSYEANMKAKKEWEAAHK